jgi:hypothetical protein
LSHEKGFYGYYRTSDSSMSPDLSRRQLLASLPALALAGCASSASEDPETTTATDDQTPTPSRTTTDEPSPTPTPTPTETPDREEQIEALPEPSPLGSFLQEIFVADDPAAAAEGRDVPYQDGAVKVRIELVEGGEIPEEFVEERLAKQEEMVVAWVPVANLVDLATAPDVRIVRAWTPPKTH